MAAFRRMGAEPVHAEHGIIVSVFSAGVQGVSVTLRIEANVALRKVESNPLAAVLADVSGKGISAALLSSMILGCLQMQLRANVSPHEALNRLNQFLCEKSSTSRFVTSR